MMNAKISPETTGMENLCEEQLVTQLLNFRPFQKVFPGTTDKLNKWRLRRKSTELRLRHIMRNQRALFNEHGLLIAPADQTLEDLTTRKSMIPVILPTSRFFAAWLMLTTLVFILLLMLTSYTIAFHYGNMQLAPDHWVEIANLCIDCILLIDCAVHFNVATYVGDTLVTDRKEIAKKYLKGYFIVDLVASVPMVWILRAVHHSDSNNSERVARSARFLKLVKVVRTIKVARVLKLIRAMHTLEERMAHDSFSPVALFFHVSKLLIMLVLLAHISACVMVLIAHYEDDTCDWIDAYFKNINCVDFLDSDSVDDGPKFLNGPDNNYRLYVTSLYWAATTLTTVGYGDVVPQTTLEMWWSVVVQFSGTCALGYILSQITATVAFSDRTAEIIKEKLLVINSYMKYRDMPQDLCVKIRAHYAQSWQEESVWDEEQILSELPGILRSEILNFVNLRKLEGLNVPWLSSGTTKEEISALSLHLYPQRHLPGDSIILEGKHGTEMYVIRRGETHTVVTSDLIAQLAPVEPQIFLFSSAPGGTFAEYALFLQGSSKHPVSVIPGPAGCDLFYLAKANFRSLAEHFPNLRSRFLQLAASSSIALLKVLSDVKNFQLKAKVKRRDHIDGDDGEEETFLRGRSFRSSLRGCHSEGAKYKKPLGKSLRNMFKSKGVDFSSSNSSASETLDDTIDTIDVDSIFQGRILKAKTVLKLIMWSRRAIIRTMNKNRLEFYGPTGDKAPPPPPDDKKQRKRSSLKLANPTTNFRATASNKSIAAPVGALPAVRTPGTTAVTDTYATVNRRKSLSSSVEIFGAMAKHPSGRRISSSSEINDDNDHLLLRMQQQLNRIEAMLLAQQSVVSQQNQLQRRASADRVGGTIP